jgi:hypothetical protein
LKLALAQPRPVSGVRRFLSRARAESTRAIPANELYFFGDCDTVCRVANEMRQLETQGQGAELLESRLFGNPAAVPPGETKLLIH